MKKLLILLLILTGCKAKTVYVPVERKTTETVTLRDTVVDVLIEYQRDSVITPDSTSFLSNPYGYSRAEIRGGNLHHILSTWPDLSLQVPVKYIFVERVDSIPVPYPVEMPVEKKLSWWQKLRMRAGEIAVVLLLVIGLYILLKK